LLNKLKNIAGLNNLEKQYIDLNYLCDCCKSWKKL
jgi:hypothetical protein